MPIIVFLRESNYSYPLYSKHLNIQNFFLKIFVKVARWMERMNLLFSFNTNMAPNVPHNMTNFPSSDWTQIYLITLQVKIILRPNFETICKFNVKLSLVNFSLNQNTNFFKTSESSALFINSKMLNKLLSQGHAKWVKVWLQKETNKVKAESRNGWYGN